MSQKITVMQEALIKVLASMKMEEENKVLIAMKLNTSKKIYMFLNWLKKGNSGDTGGNETRRDSGQSGGNQSIIKPSLKPIQETNLKEEA